MIQRGMACSVRVCLYWRVASKARFIHFALGVFLNFQNHTPGPAKYGRDVQWATSVLIIDSIKTGKIAEEKKIGIKIPTPGLGNLIGAVDIVEDRVSGLCMWRRWWPLNNRSYDVKIKKKRIIHDIYFNVCKWNVTDRNFVQSKAYDICAQSYTMVHIRARLSVLFLDNDKLFITSNVCMTLAILIKRFVNLHGNQALYPCREISLRRCVTHRNPF